MFDPVEKAAEALWRSDPHVPDFCRWPDAAPNPDSIRRTARAVVDALGLTEETRVLDEGMGGGTATFARLVGPWAEQWERSEK